MSETELPEDLNELVKHNELLRNYLVKISFAAVGINTRLDLELQQLRTLVRANTDIDHIHQQVESIARLLMTLDDEIEQGLASLTQEQLLQGLLKLLTADFPEHKSQLEQIIRAGANRPLFKTLNRITQALSSDYPRPGFFSRLFSTKKRKSSDVADTFHQHSDDSLQKIQQTVLQILDQFNVPEKFIAQLSLVKKSLSDLDSIDQIPDVMTSLTTLVLEMSSEDTSRFEHFLKQLNQRLDIVQDLLKTHTAAQTKDNQANKTMDAEVRAQVSLMQENVSTANDLKQLQYHVEHRLELVISKLDVFQVAHDSFVKKNQQKMGLLNNQLNVSRSDIEELQQKLIQQQHLAETDPLTRLPNRYAFQKKINEEYMRWRRYRQPLALAMVDIDHFKKINDQFGHANGDRVLTGLASGLLDASRETDFVARYGGEEFIIILPETHLNQATKAVNKIRQKIAHHPFDLDHNSQHITLSIGVAEFEDNDTIEDVIHRADVALYRAKDKGRNAVCCELKFAR